MDKLYRKKLEKIYRKVDKLALKGKENATAYYKYIDDLIQKEDYGAFEQMLYYYYDIDILDVESVEVVKHNTWDKILFQTTTSFLKGLKRLYKRREVYQDSFDIHSTSTNLLVVDLSDPLSLDYSPSGTTQSISLEVSGDVINVDVLNTDIYTIQIFRADWENGEPINTDIIQNINVGTASSYQTQIPTTHTREYLITTYQRDSNGLPQDYKLYNYKVDMSRETLLGQIKEFDTYTQDAKYLMENKEYARLIGEVRYFLEVTKNGVKSYVTEDDPTVSFDQNLLNRYNLALDILLED